MKQIINQYGLTAKEVESARKAFPSFDYMLGNLKAVPHYMHESLVQYVVKGRRPGDFLSSMLADKFREATCRADPQNAACIIEWSREVLTCLPLSALGSLEAVHDWCQSGGLLGLTESGEGDQ